MSAAEGSEAAPRYAGFWRRAPPTVVDAAALWLASVVIVLGIAAATPNLDDNTGGAIVGVALVVVYWLYFAAQESSAARGTLGKRLVGIAVTDGNGARISFGRATGRYFAKVLSGAVLGIGYWMAAFTRRKQGLHDLICTTVVVRR